MTDSTDKAILAHARERELELMRRHVEILLALKEVREELKHIGRTLNQLQPPQPRSH